MIEILKPTVSRKNFLLLSGASIAASILGNPYLSGAQTSSGSEAAIPPTEDLMREHGALSRILLIYDNVYIRLMGKSPFTFWEALASSARIVRRFVEDYHEKLEEQYVFTQWKSGALGDLAKLLHDQHDAGRKVTDQILKLAETSPLSVSQRTNLASLLLSFNRMYRPHKAREDTFLFHAFRAAVPPKEFSNLGDEFENREKQMFGDKGFEKIVDEIAGYEKTFGINDLSKFTPKV